MDILQQIKSAQGLLNSASNLPWKVIWKPVESTRCIRQKSEHKKMIDEIMRAFKAKK